MELCSLLTADELWRKIDGIVYEGHGVAVCTEKFGSLVRMDASLLEGEIIGTAIHLDSDEFMGALLDLMTTGNKNYHVKMNDGDVAVFTITNENKGD